MARTTITPMTKWDTMHNNGPFPLKLHYDTDLAGETFMPAKLDRYRDAANEIRRLLQDTLNTGHGFRAYGSRWSMSNIAHHPDRMHFNSRMNLHLPLESSDYHSQTTYAHDNLFFFECGNTIKELHNTLSSHGKSLKTTGASNGQTIAGCISTGVHGSAIDVGAIQDYVVGLNLITGPNPGDIYYLERHTRPALSDSFAQKIQALVIRNDALFNAALVGLGGFGFVHGVAIEAEDIFLLKRYVRMVKKELAMELADTLDFANSPFKIDGETDAQGRGLRPFHYKVFINPYTNETEYPVEVMYKKTYSEPYPDPIPDITTSVYRDLIYLLIKISEKFPKSIPWFIKKLQKAKLPKVNEITTGTMREIFWDAPYLGPAFALSFGVAHTNSSKAMQILAELTKKEGPIPGIYAMRFIRQSEATLAFSRFPFTCMIEIDGVLWEKSKKLMSLTEFGRRMIQVLQAEGIPFTIHWGKNADWAFPGLVDHMYGNAVDEWRARRTALLSTQMAQVFSNDFLNTTQLSTLVPNPDPQLIASL